MRWYKIAEDLFPRPDRGRSLWNLNVVGLSRSRYEGQCFRSQLFQNVCYYIFVTFGENAQNISICME